MNKLLVLTYLCSASSVQNWRSIHKRLANGFPVTDLSQTWYFTATVEIFHNSRGQWLRHPVCLGSFLHVGEKLMVVTTADCFFPPGYNHTQFSYMSKHNYRVFLGVVRIRYGHTHFSGMDVFGLRSSIHYPLVIIHPEWKFGNSTEDTNIAIITITAKCYARLNLAKIQHFIHEPPIFLNLPVTDDIIRGFCEVVGWTTDLNQSYDIFKPDENKNVGLKRQNLSLSIGQFQSLDSATCNQHLLNLNIDKQLADPSFCISGTMGNCLEFFLSSYEYGGGVICNGVWRGFISAIFNVNVAASQLVQIATVTSAAATGRFVETAQFSYPTASCAVADVLPRGLGRGDPSVFIPNLAKDYASP